MIFKHTFKSGKTGTLHVREDADFIDLCLDLKNQMHFLRQQYDNEEVDAWMEEVSEWCEKNLRDYI